ncbi:hypothetical protein D3C84_910980 [compost metagenome]
MANGRFELLVIKTLKEKATVITKHFRLKDKNIGDLGLNNIHHEYLVYKWG